MMVGSLLSYWEGNFSGAMLIFGGVAFLSHLKPKQKNMSWKSEFLKFRYVGLGREQEEYRCDI